MRKAEFFWAIVGDANPEPVVVVVEDGKRVAYTIGCADPFPLDGESPNIEIVEKGNLYHDGGRQTPVKLDPPEKVRAAQHVKRREQAEARLASDRKRGIIHGWQRWNP